MSAQHFDEPLDTGAGRRETARKCWRSTSIPTRNPSGRERELGRDWVGLTVEFAGSAALVAVTGGVLQVFDGPTAIHAGCALTATGGVLAFLAQR